MATDAIEAIMQKDQEPLTLRRRRLPIGAEVFPGSGVHFRVWSTRAQCVEVVIEDGAASRELPEVADLGITLIEVMPVADFVGRFGWSYDGVDLVHESIAVSTDLEGRSGACRDIAVTSTVHNDLRFDQHLYVLYVAWLYTCLPPLETR